jgi:predicted small lipoprotein YifL
MMGKLFIVMLIVALAAPLTACGKKGPNEPPPGKESTYPKQYPQ